MRYPMILPWLARKSGVSLPAARRLWDQVMKESEQKFAPEIRGSAFWGHTIAEFRRRLNSASRRRVVRREAERDVTGMFWVQGRILCEAMAAWTGYLRGACAVWPRLLLARPRIQ
jgi:hypothetical protein